MSDRELRIEKKWFLAAMVDPEKFSFFYKKYRSRIYRFVLLKTGDEEAAADLTAETFLLAQKGLSGFKWQGVTFGAWLYRIAVNLVRHHHRLRKRAHAVDLENAPEIATEELPPLDSLVREERERILHDSLRVLGEGDTTIFLLHYWMEHTTAEVAAITDMPEGTVKTRLQRGREILGREVARRLADRRDGFRGDGRTG